MKKTWMKKHLVIRIFTNVTPILGLRTWIHDTGRIPVGTGYAEIIPSSVTLIITSMLTTGDSINTTHRHRQNQRNNCLQLNQEHNKWISRLIHEMLIQAKRSSHPPKTWPCPPPGQTHAHWRSKTSRELKLMLCRPVSINFTFTRQDYKKKSNSCKGKAMVLLNADVYTKDEFKLIHGARLNGFLPLTWWPTCVTLATEPLTCGSALTLSLNRDNGQTNTFKLSSFDSCEIKLLA